MNGMNSELLQRRRFLTCSLSTIFALRATQAFTADAPAEKREFYELRTFYLSDETCRKRLSDYLEQALLPALKRITGCPAGAFQSTDMQENRCLTVVISFSSLQEFGEWNERLNADITFQHAAKDYFAQTAEAPVWHRMESQLLQGLACLPKLVLPNGNTPHLFELRRYESPNLKLARLTVEMFNEGRLDELMRQAGLAPVFFGETLIGNGPPNLTYLLSAENEEEHEKHWRTFRSDPRWERIRQMKKFQSTISEIRSRFLKPLAYSDIR
ncbi:MAG: hypothetical protein CME31_28070 [Gimesia sp.]|uniref:NIPSNAP domain-containing protein n=1 Tax=Gimesia maris TaxID=122 RepID=A0A3D3R8I9_9PLAN|nr:hypothetical protein [Gimesia sp.]HCO24402.1 hypothetical protein [Gimesia maris]|tara:strand:+ start:9121 stop:9930 length:810 start_codon:yes stop_codon:yes gene_type:complete